MKKKRARVKSIIELRNSRELRSKDRASDALGFASVENIRIAIGSIIWEGYLIERMLKEILTDVIPMEYILKSKRLRKRRIDTLTLGSLIGVFGELGINQPLVSRAFKWKEDRNNIVHQMQTIMLEHNANQSTPEGKANLYSYLLDVVSEALEIKIRFSALKLWHDQKTLGDLQPPPPEKRHGHIERLFSELLPSAYADFELHKLGF